MQVLSPRIDMTEFRRRLSGSASRVLMLDYDGTLAPFKVRPEHAVPYPGIADCLNALLEQGDTRVVIVSGRRAAEVAALLPLARRPEIWGAHGWEHVTPDGEVSVQQAGEDVREALSAAERAAARCSLPGTRLERKPASLAFHWRGVPAQEAEPLRERLAGLWEPLAAGGPLELLPFDGGLELRARGANKQHAVKAILAGTTPDMPSAYLGDDLTDEDAFRAVKAQGLAVLVRPEFRKTEADVWIRPPEELLEFLALWRRPAASA